MEWKYAIGIEANIHEPITSLYEFGMLRNCLVIKTCPYLITAIAVLLCETADSENFRRFEKRRQGALVHVNFSVVDELHQGVEVCPRDILQDYHRVFAGSRLEQTNDFKEQTSQIQSNLMASS